MKEELLAEVVLLMGYCTLQHTKNQELFHWGNSPTLLQSLCLLPFQYFSDPKCVLNIAIVPFPISSKGLSQCRHAHDLVLQIEDPGRSRKHPLWAIIDPELELDPCRNLSDRA